MDNANQSENHIPIETSARHVHLTQQLVEILFGKEHKLTPDRHLSQPTEFCSEERVDVVGPRGTLQHVAVLGPTRDKAQVELSMTDARHLGLNPPVRVSGDHEGSVSCRLVGPAGEYELETGVIVAHRHLHCSSAEAEKLSIKDGDTISIEVKNSLRPLIFEDVIVRAKDNFSLAMHVDTDEGNAAGLTKDSYGVIVKTRI